MPQPGISLIPSQPSSGLPNGFGVSGGVLQVVGTDRNDAITFSQVGDRLRVVAVLGGVRRTEFFRMAAVASIRVLARGGNDVVDNQTVRAALMFGGNGNDTLRGGRGADRLEGDAGNDLLYGREGNDLLRGGIGNDRLYGDADNDRLEGGDHHDLLWGGIGNDLLMGGRGNDQCFGQIGADDVRGGEGNDVLEGDDGDRWDAFADRVLGEAGTDTLYGTFATDVLNGGGQSGDRLRTRLFVDHAGDTVDGNFGAGKLTLREAIDQSTDYDIIHFGKLTAAAPQTIAIVNGTLALTKHLTFQGIGSAGRLTIDGSGNGPQRLFNIFSGVSVSIRNLTIRKFDSGNGNGGAIYLDQGYLTLANVVGRENKGADGGFLYLDGQDTRAVIVDSTLRQNVATWSGGAIVNNSGQMRIFRSTVSANRANVWGGGVFATGVDGGTSIEASTIDHNVAVSTGGGIRLDSGRLELVNATVSSNRSTDGGAGFDSSGLARIVHSTIVFNAASQVGGGLSLAGGGSLLNNSIVYGNTSSSAARDFASALDVSLTQSFSNLIGRGTNSGFVNGVRGNRVGVTNARIDSNLAANGGPTRTHRLLAGSIAIDNGNNAQSVDLLGAVLANDQTGRSRKVGPRVDIGAFEFRV